MLCYHWHACRFLLRTGFMRLLLIEDDAQLGKAVFQGLRQEYTADWFKSAEEGEAVIRDTPYDVIILDINLPGSSGLQWLRSLRQRKIDIPVLLLTARDTPAQRVEGLDAGADDYLIKPFDFEELLARIRALLRRRGALHENELHYRDITMDLDGKTVCKKGEVINLSAKEFDILRLLMENTGRCLSREQIEKKIYNWDDEFGSNTVEVHISGIRRKLGKEIIKTMRGIGYIMVRET